MKDEEKKEGRLMGELEVLRKRMAELEVSEAKRRLAEGALQRIQENHLLCSLYFENVSDVIYSLSPNFVVLSVSPSVERSLGYRVEELIGKPFYELDILTPFSWERAFSDARRVLTGERIHSTEYEFVTKSGDRKFGEVNAVPIYYEGKVGAILSVVRDITDRKQAEEALRESEESFRRLAENAQDVIYRYDLVPQPRLTYVSPAVTLLTGHTPKEYYDDPQLLFKLIHPSDRPLMETVSRGIMPPGNLLTFRWVHGDGTITWTESRIVPIYGKAGHLVAIEGIARDVTERKRVEDALRESEEKYRLYFERISDVIYSIDADLRVLSVSPSVERFLGYAPEELTGRHLPDLDVLAPASLELAISEARRVLAGERIPASVYEFIPKDGARKFGEVSAAPSYSEEGKVTAIISVARDITDYMQAEEALRESEGRFRKLFDNAPLGMALLGMDGHVLRVNQPLCRFLGYSPHEMAGMHLRELTYPEDLDIDSGLYEALVKGERSSYSIDKRYVGKHGEVLWGRLSVSMIRDDQDLPQYMIVACEDIRVWKRAEEALRDSEARYRDFFESANDVILIVDEKGNILDINKRGEELTGFTHQELIQRNLFEELILPEDREAMMELMRNLLAGKKQRYEVRLRARDKAVISFEGSSSPYLSENGQFISAQCILRDITSRKQAEESLRESEVRYRAVVEQSPDGIALLDGESKRILEANAAFQRMLGYSAEEIRRLSIYDFVVADREDIEQRFQSVVRNQGPISFERQLRRKDGSLVDVWVSAKVISYGGREIICAVTRELTEKKALEAKFLQAQRLESVGLLAGGIAHHLNDIVFSILMNAELLQQSLVDPKAQQMLSSIQSNAQRGADIVRRMLTLSRGTMGEHLPLSLKYLMDEMEKVLHETFPESIQLKTEIPEDLWPLSGNATQLHQMLMNLCVNAKDAMPQGGSLTLSAENATLDESYAATHPEAKPGPYVLFSISDTGVGIPAQDIGKIFDPFFTTKERDGAIGLGLSTVYGIVKGHGGFIQVYSEVGKGTKIHVYLPASPSPETARAKEEEEVPLPSGKGEFILVVDDEASVCDLIETTLEAHGYRVLTAFNGARAVALYASLGRLIQAVVIDMAIPVMDGPATIKALHRMDPKIKIIATSETDAERALAEAAGSLVTSFLPKPISVNALLRTLRAILGSEERTPCSGEQRDLGPSGLDQGPLSPCAH